MVQRFKLELEFKTILDGHVPKSDESPANRDSVYSRFFQEFINNPEAFCANVLGYLIDMIRDEDSDMLLCYLQYFQKYKANFQMKAPYYLNLPPTTPAGAIIIKDKYHPIISLEKVRLVYPFVSEEVTSDKYLEKE